MLLWIILMWKIAIIDIGISKAAVYSLTQINVAVYDMSKQSMQTLDQPAIFYFAWKRLYCYIS